MDRVRKRLAILGSTGSIGQQTLEVVQAFPDRLEVAALAAGSNTTLLKQQTQQFKPKLVSSQATNQSLPLEEIAGHPDIDLVMVATSGKAGLLPTLAAIRARKIVALANKEALVMAGQIVMAEAEKHAVEIRPVDSEHSAIWQCLQGEASNKIAQIILTASGGPFRNRSMEDLAMVTASEALRHPIWKMGRKVTIDSANLMNKGMEVIEAHWLFGVPFDKIKVMVHPGSIIHSMVEFTDGSVKAQLGMPDMRLPIQYALSHPERWANPALPKIDFDKVESLKLEPVNLERYPCLRLALEAGKAGDTHPAVLSAADEIAVDRFLSGDIGFLDIPKLLENTLGKHKRVSNPTLNDILAADSWAREAAKGWRSK
ncbi:MAG: 1-deoxy-D-xylulose-5-phosphate reductoisomerase [Dehalococcoidia bacterium]|nr:1-deoxy-D-xylulose-5-phosphate reductoisomerase [Dehalococcoidia bacterium]